MLASQTAFQIVYPFSPFPLRYLGNLVLGEFTWPILAVDES